MRRPLLAGIACCLVVACGKAPDPTPESGDEAPKPVVAVSTAPLVRGTLQATLAVPGTLAPLPKQEAKIAPLTAGRVLKVFVKAGDRVVKGQPVAQMDPGTLMGEIKQAEATVATSRATLAQARLNYQSQVSSQGSAVQEAQTNLEAQRVALRKLLAGSRPQEVAQAQSQVTSAQSALQAAEQNLSRSQTLYSQGLLARKDLEAAQSEERTSRAQLQSAEAALSLAKQGNRPEDIQAGRIAVVQAEQQLKAAQRQTTENASKGQDVNIAAAQLQNALGALASARAQLSALTIRSPLSGVVIGDTPNPGEAIDTTGVVATVVNLSSVRVLLSVPVAQLNDVRSGQVVTFSPESNPGAIHYARVSVVNRAVDPNTNTVQVEAIAPNLDGSLKDDGFVKAQIVTASHSGVLIAPVDAVVEVDGKPTVFTVGSDSLAHAVEVTTGVRQGAKEEIRGALQAGDKVVTQGAFELEDGTEVRTPG